MFFFWHDLEKYRLSNFSLYVILHSENNNEYNQSNMNDFNGGRHNAWFAVCGSKSRHIPTLWTADEFEWQCIHDNSNKWSCAQ